MVAVTARSGQQPGGRSSGRPGVRPPRRDATPRRPPAPRFRPARAIVRCYGGAEWLSGRAHLDAAGCLHVVPEAPWKPSAANPGDARVLTFAPGQWTRVEWLPAEQEPRTGLEFFEEEVDRAA